MVYNHIISTILCIKNIFLFFKSGLLSTWKDAYNLNNYWAKTSSDTFIFMISLGLYYLLCVTISRALLFEVYFHHGRIIKEKNKVIVDFAKTEIRNLCFIYYKNIFLLKTNEIIRRK